MDAFRCKLLLGLLQLHKLLLAERTPIRGAREQQQQTVLPFQRVKCLGCASLVLCRNRWNSVSRRQPWNLCAALCMEHARQDRKKKTIRTKRCHADCTP